MLVDPLHKTTKKNGHNFNSIKSPLLVIPYFSRPVLAWNYLEMGDWVCPLSNKLSLSIVQVEMFLVLLLWFRCKSRKWKYELQKIRYWDIANVCIWAPDIVLILRYIYLTSKLLAHDMHYSFLWFKSLENFVFFWLIILFVLLPFVLLLACISFYQHENAGNTQVQKANANSHPVWKSKDNFWKGQ